MTLKEYFNVDRRDSGWLRLLLSMLFAVVTLFFLYAGYLLLRSGVSGNWQVLSSFNGWSLYVASTSPGILVILAGAVILSCGLPKTLKNL